MDYVSCKHMLAKQCTAEVALQEPGQGFAGTEAFTWLFAGLRLIQQQHVVKHLSCDLKTLRAQSRPQGPMDHFGFRAGCCWIHKLDFQH